MTIKAKIFKNKITYKKINSHQIKNQVIKSITILTIREMTTLIILCTRILTISIIHSRTHKKIHLINLITRTSKRISTLLIKKSVLHKLIIFIKMQLLPIKIILLIKTKDNWKNKNFKMLLLMNKILLSPKHNLLKSP